MRKLNSGAEKNQLVNCPKMGYNNLLNVLLKKFIYYDLRFLYLMPIKYCISTKEMAFFHSGNSKLYRKKKDIKTISFKFDLSFQIEALMILSKNIK